MPKFLLVTLILLLIVASGVGLREFQQRQFVLGQATERNQKVQKIYEQINGWEQIASASPTYRDAYVQLAIDYWQLAATPEARQNLQRVLELDPNWVVPPQLEPLLRLLP